VSELGGNEATHVWKLGSLGSCGTLVQVSPRKEFCWPQKNTKGVLALWLSGSTISILNIPLFICHRQTIDFLLIAILLMETRKSHNHIITFTNNHHKTPLIYSYIVLSSKIKPKNLVCSTGPLLGLDYPWLWSIAFEYHCHSSPYRLDNGQYDTFAVSPPTKPSCIGTNTTLSLTLLGVSLKSFSSAKWIYELKIKTHG